MFNFKKENYFLILFILSFLTLTVAYVIQYILGYQPCNLCIIERIPYALAIIILILNYNFKRNQDFYSILLVLIFLFSFLISLYHYGIEQNLIEESTVCASKNLDLITKKDILESLQDLNISCKDVTFKILGLSLTTYNIGLSLFMLFISTKIYIISNDYKK